MEQRFSWAIFLTALAISCSSTPTKITPPVDAGPGADVGKSCTQDVECGGLRCDQVLHHCICLSDSDCTPSDGGVGYCNNFSGLCQSSINGCTADSQCASDQYCNPFTRSCDTLIGFCQTCSSDTGCGPGNECLLDGTLNQNFCGTACSTDSDCASGANCQPVGEDGGLQCWPAPGTNCKTFTGCTPDLNIDCSSDSDCNPDGGSGQVCSQGGLCKAQDQVCPAGTICDPNQRVCVTSCAEDIDCSTDGSLVCEGQLCKPPNPCQLDTDCPSDKVCSIPIGNNAGICVAFCESFSADAGLNASCPTGTICLPVVESDGSQRYSCQGGCSENGDCPLTTVCMDGSGNVIAQPNGTLGTCNSAFPDGTPACQTTLTCGATCQWCNTSFQCETATNFGLSQGICSTCQTDADCQASTHQANSFCLPLDPNSSQGYCGYPCLGSLTGPTGGVDGESCPKGFVCAALTGSNDMVNGMYNCIPATQDCLDPNNGDANICQ